MASDGRIRLTLLGGFLGSGKTTWLRHQLHVGAWRGAAVLVNEAAETPVDDALLPGARVLAGGCACCSGRAALVTELRRLCDLRSRAGDGPDEIVLETSGVADPGPIIAAIRGDPVLAYHVLVAEVIVLVDARHGLDQLAREPLGRRQIEAADRLILTKLDTAADLATLCATLRALNPAAGQMAAHLGSPVPLPPLPAGARPAPLADLTDRGAIFPTEITLAGQTDWPAFTVWLSALLHARGEDVMRVKGVVRTPAGRLLIQTVRKQVQSPEILPEQSDRRDDTIVVIGRGYQAQDLHRSFARFARP